MKYAYLIKGMLAMLGPHWLSVWKVFYLLFWCVSNLFKVLSGSTYVKLPRLSPHLHLLSAPHLLMSPGSETTGYLEECFRAEKDNYYLLFFNVSENFMFSHGCLPWWQSPQLQCCHLTALRKNGIMYACSTADIFNGWKSGLVVVYQWSSDGRTDRGRCQRCLRISHHRRHRTRAL